MVALNDEKYYTPEEVAQKFNVHTSTISRWRRDGILISYPLNKRKHLYSETQIEEFVKLGTK
jgi:DNA-binding transcriptional MerR regulator